MEKANETSPTNIRIIEKDVITADDLRRVILADPETAMIVTDVLSRNPYPQEPAPEEIKNTRHPQLYAWMGKAIANPEVRINFDMPIEASELVREDSEFQGMIKRKTYGINADTGSETKAVLQTFARELHAYGSLALKNTGVKTGKAA
jgi:hypothetical protein